MPLRVIIDTYNLIVQVLSSVLNKLIMKITKSVCLKRIFS